MLGLALTVAAPAVARAQHFDPLQAAAIAESVVGMVFGPMYATPRCGPHDALPQPYQPRTPSYNPPPQPDQHSNLDDDDDDDYSQPVQPPSRRHLGTYSLQPQTRPNAQDESEQTTDQTTDVRARDAGQSDNQAVLSEDEQRPVQVHAQRRSGHRNRHPQAVAQTQSSGQVAEIPSLPRATQASSGSDGFAPEQ
jgi:hypothetical protein